MLKHLKQNKKYLKKQIQIISPDIIITGLTWREHRNELFDNLQWLKSGYNIEIAKYNNAKVVDFYHPSARIPASASYSLLENITKSIPFKHL